MSRGRRIPGKSGAQRHVVVVGAGLSGLAAALHLAGDGYRVTVLEREAIPGGRNGLLEQDGFTFDTGPMVFTMVSLLEEAFSAVGTRVPDYVTLKQLDPAYHAHLRRRLHACSCAPATRRCAPRSPRTVRREGRGRVRQVRRLAQAAQRRGAARTSSTPTSTPR